MLGSSILDLAVGMVFLFFVLSLLCSTINEWIVSLTNRRGVFLRKAIEGAFASVEGKGGLPSASESIQALYTAPAIRALSTERGTLGKLFYSRLPEPFRSRREPSYIPVAIFAAAVSRLPQSSSLPWVEEAIKSSPGQVSLGASAPQRTTSENAGETTVFSEEQIGAIRQWYEALTEKTSDDYKRLTQTWLILIALFVVPLVNANSIRIFSALYRQPNFSSAIAQGALQRAMTLYVPEVDTVTTTKPGSQEKQLSAQLVAVQDAFAMENSPLGWTKQELEEWDNKAVPKSIPALEAKPTQAIAGWTLSIIGISLGAPFWFDVLNRMSGLRKVGAGAGKTDRKGT